MLVMGVFYGTGVLLGQNCQAGPLVPLINLGVFY